ncbi:hypothetical protein SERLA73DRAFT_84509 [Serpula lacrymans var. lacrymans S7.3]|uniref:Nramp-domain-containing protein n=2 Tax=Serpula lacrymans var. lacrymans TaxID=341189 RepID=F8PM98_SERL3|nr:uncharacterized protein SERLADRAFT_434345 [Serpula lacrymans var. lacrymans S7.9]EGO02730.1 hypothetical protein SERLA73DRAFT_84509 [Serpula lacrymans var. lacrymans S7.3]EGO28430.1 hypothetical protein SERLADRAFT_434345 [Serpula lacrymans var. lacrymans S7.9]
MSSQIHSRPSSPPAHSSSHVSTSSTSSLAREKWSARSVLKILVHHMKRHVGVGIVCAVGYFDPGNWSVDLQAGSSFGYRPMLFVILLSGIIAIVLQVLAARLGCVTGLDLASHCRLLLHDHPKHPRLVRRLVLYPLYALCEIAIISTDLAELLGSAIGFCLLFPTLPLWSGVLLTGADVLIFLIIGDPSRGGGRPVRLFEFTIIILVAVVFVCFIILLIRMDPAWPEVFLGFLPSQGLFQTQPNAVYTSIGIVGATVMPHALFLGSSLATQDRVSTAPRPLPTPSTTSEPGVRGRWTRIRRALFSIYRSEKRESKDLTTRHGLRENNSLKFISAHIRHGTVDVVLSLLAVAVPINSAILILAATVFYSPDNTTSVGLFNMHTLVGQSLGKGAALMFALALICSGQTASITATLAGQIVSEGFILWNISPFFRRLITRLISLIPSMIVAVAFGRSGINTLLVASQVALSVVLPFVAFPLIYLTSSKTVMSVPKPAISSPEPYDDAAKASSPEPAHRSVTSIADVVRSPPELPSTHIDINLHDEEKSNIIVNEVHEVNEADQKKPTVAPTETVDFSSGYVLTGLAYAIWLVVLVANVYAIVALGMGETGQ